MINYSLRIQEDNRFRFWISILSFVVSALFVAHRGSSALFLTILLFISYTFFYGLGHLLSKTRLAGMALHLILTAGDVIAVTSIIYITGGIGSPLYFLYLVILGVAIYQKALLDFVFAGVLSVILYSGLLWNMPVGKTVPVTMLGGQLVLLVTLTGVLGVILLMILKDEALRQKLVSRAKTLAHVSDVLSGSLSNSRDWIKNITKLVEEEIREDDLTCRIVIHRGHQQFLPPAGDKMGAQFPIMVGECVFGALIISREKSVPLSSTDQDFFSSISRSLGLSLHRAKLWEDFHNRLEEIEKYFDPPKEVPAAGGHLAENGKSAIQGMIDVVRSERTQI